MNAPDLARHLGAPARPRVVAIGGGHGLACSLGAARQFAGEITAIASVADDGGSSGRLREAFGIPAPGDLRKCLTALLPGKSALGDALEYRFVGGELDGHAFGNLLLAALGATTGDFVKGVEQACQVLAAVGAVWPATREAVVLRAVNHQRALEGQVAIATTPGITAPGRTKVTLDPPDVPAPAQALEAIARADLLVCGPGSLYTSVLAALIAGRIPEAIAASSARLVYVCNLREQIPETEGYDVGSHVEALLAHGIVPDVVLADTSGLRLGAPPTGIEVIETPLARPSGTVHDEALLAGALRALLR